MKKVIVRVAAVTAMLALAVIGFQYAGKAQAAPAPKVTICHATGQAPSTHFVELSTKALSPYGAEGHVDANGTPLAGHEQDIILQEGQECPCDKKY